MTTGDHSHRDLYHRGLAFDVGTLLRRRRMLGMLAGTGLALTVAGCASTDSASPSSPASSGTPSAPRTGSTGASDAGASADTTTDIPHETAGPFPGRRSNR